MDKAAGSAQLRGLGPSLVDQDAWLEPYQGKLAWRESQFQKRLQELEERFGKGGLEQVSKAHRYFGFNRGEYLGQKGIWYREWAPGAKALFLIGDFNQWNRSAHPMKRDLQGNWSLFLPDSATGTDSAGGALSHESRVKVHVHTESLGPVDRIPAFIRRAVQEPSGDFNGQYWEPPHPYRFKNQTPHRKGGLRIYEAHVGMAQEEGKVGTFSEFTRLILPRIASLGYNAVQLMAIMEHPYYASFGYHVSNFFAVSSRFGTPEELKELVDVAHGLGLQVFLDLVHSHAVKNANEGLNLLDGTDHQYFHAGARGNHVAWDSLLFDYAKPEVLRFLLSNVRFWLEDYHFDGFRFDGVTSMLYRDHGLNRTFTSYDDYFGDNVDEDALIYMKLANRVAHATVNQITTIAEEVSGMPGTARPVKEGGLGFDYRLAMGAPDAWIKLLKEKREEDWSLGEIYGTLLNRRRTEKHVGYAESHDQALVGDVTLAFRLMDQEMYWKMAKAEPSVIIDRGIALHKLIRLITFSLAGDAWLNFMGNEFGHPEWIDFPREGNQNSFLHARRQWSLGDRTDLRYRGLLEFDRAMLKLDGYYGLYQQSEIAQLAVHEDQKQLVYRRGPLLFAFNFHPTQSCSELRIPAPEARDYRVILNTDDVLFEGHGRVKESVTYPWQRVPMYGQEQSVQIYLPNRSAQVLIGC
ncbi:MAG: alpha amylase C-terminal domain-containing protein [Methylotenera sp.]|nr:alpha amylase C-terminal domain-containing protein [Oligoflexia bacterium]